MVPSTNTEQEKWSVVFSGLKKHKCVKDAVMKFNTTTMNVQCVEST